MKKNHFCNLDFISKNHSKQLITIFDSIILIHLADSLKENFLGGRAP